MWQHNRPKTFYSVLGAYAYNDNLFDNFVLHENININKNDLIEYIIYENADLPLHVVNLDLLKIKIGLWCKKNKENWLRIYEALYQKYNPLHNFDRYEELSDTSKLTSERENTRDSNTDYSERGTLTHEGDKLDTFNTSDVTSYGKTDTRTDNLTDSIQYGKTDTRTDNLTDRTITGINETVTHNGTETNTHENTAFNEGVSITARDTINKNLSDVTDRGEDTTRTNTGTQGNVTGGSDTTNHTGTQGNVTGGSDTLAKTGTIKTDDDFTDTKNNASETEEKVLENETFNNQELGTHNGHLYGNIGVTTSQKMLQDEIDVRFNSNFYDIISSQFKLEFCVMIY